MKGIYRLGVHLPAFSFVTGSAPSATGSVFPTPSSVETAISQRFYLRSACGGSTRSEKGTTRNKGSIPCGGASGAI